MGARYLLTCSCGAVTPVSPSQAGGVVTCECGVRLDIPRLGQLRDLPVESEEPAPSRGGWGFRQGVGSAGLLVGLVLGGLAVWWAMTEPAPPPPFDAELYKAQVNEQLDSLSPVELWDRFQAAYGPLSDTGFTKAEFPLSQRIEELIAQSRAFQFGLASAAGASLLIALVAFVALPRTV